MDLGDLLNLDYGYDAWGMPMYDSVLSPDGFSLGGGDGLASVLGAPIDYGEMAYSLGVPGIDDVPLRPSVIDMNPGGADALGFLGPDGGLQTLGGQPIAPDPFGIRTGPPDDPFNFRSGISTPMSAGRVMQDAARLSGGGGRGGGPLNISMPRIETSPAASIDALVPGAAVAPGAMPATAAPAPFTPMNAATPLAQSPDDPRGIARLLRALGER